MQKRRERKKTANENDKRQWKGLVRSAIAGARNYAHKFKVKHPAGIYLDQAGFFSFL